MLKYNNTQLNNPLEMQTFKQNISIILLYSFYDYSYSVYRNITLQEF